ncbi:MAG: hypothetical protein KAS32_25665 [Candidatus Peribacteraceae bacterium]|nr:hypothetical protein [Candidatus Peribacteraceae bacterium]
MEQDETHRPPDIYGGFNHPSEPASHRIVRDSNGIPLEERIDEPFRGENRDRRFHEVARRHEESRTVHNFMRDMINLFSQELEHTERFIMNTVNQEVEKREAKLIGQMEDLLETSLTDRISESVVDRVEATIDKSDTVRIGDIEVPAEMVEFFDIKASKIAGILLNDVQQNFTGRAPDEGFIEEMHERWHQIILEILNGKRQERFTRGEAFIDVSFVEEPTDIRTLRPDIPDHVRERVNAAAGIRENSPNQVGEGIGEAG